ncbi:MAG: type VI secretion system baseplate subunit TssE [Chitinivibrionales bacterium]|nr:type VI secretion system baseplate subunit TssE [Chitinivibrionales bacterium]
MNQALFESLTGHFLDKTPVDSIAPQSRRVLSIMDHLTRMFNTREGSIPHLEDYGLPDISEIYRKMPDGIEDLQGAIRRTVEKYEPRLKKAKVIRTEPKDKEFKIEFILSGELKEGGVVRFQTVFTSMGNSQISPWKRPD